MEPEKIISDFNLSPRQRMELMLYQYVAMIQNGEEPSEEFCAECKEIAVALITGKRPEIITLGSDESDDSDDEQPMDELQDTNLQNKPRKPKRKRAKNRACKRSLYLCDRCKYLLLKYMCSPRKAETQGAEQLATAEQLPMEMPKNSNQEQKKKRSAKKEKRIWQSYKKRTCKPYKKHAKGTKKRVANARDQPFKNFNPVDDFCQFMKMFQRDHPDMHIDACISSGMKAWATMKGTADKLAEVLDYLESIDVDEDIPLIEIWPILEPEGVPKCTPMRAPKRKPKNARKRTLKNAPKRTLKNARKRTLKNARKRTPKNAPKRTPKRRPKGKKMGAAQPVCSVVSTNETQTGVEFLSVKQAQTELYIAAVSEEAQYNFAADAQKLAFTCPVHLQQDDVLNANTTIAPIGGDEMKFSSSTSKQRTYYANFLAEFAAKHPDLSPDEISENAAKAWSRMNKAKRRQYFKKALPSPPSPPSDDEPLD